MALKLSWLLPLGERKYYARAHQLEVHTGRSHHTMFKRAKWIHDGSGSEDEQEDDPVLLKNRRFSGDFVEQWPVVSFTFSQNLTTTRVPSLATRIPRHLLGYHHSKNSLRSTQKMCLKLVLTRVNCVLRRN